MALRSINKQNSSSDGHRAFTFSVAALCVIICFVASAIPVPLIAIWSRALALTTFEVSMTVFAYIGGCLAVLLFFSKLSNYFGRKTTVILALAIGIASCLCFIDPHNASALILGRLLQGVFAGLVTSAAMSWTVDTAPKSHAWLGTALSSAGPGIGFIFGTCSPGSRRKPASSRKIPSLLDLPSRLPSCSQQQYHRSKRCSRGVCHCFVH